MSDQGVAVARALDRIAVIPSAVADRIAPVDRIAVADRTVPADRIVPAVQSAEALSVALAATNAPAAGRFAPVAENEVLASRSLTA